MTAAIAAALLANAGCAVAGTHTVPITPVAEAPRGCPLTVRFGSYAMGIDRGAFEKISALLSRDRGVRAIEQYRWGREGEVTLCVRTRSKVDARRLFARVRGLFPARPRGPLTVSVAGGPSFTSSRP
jgi:hypothetical protein